MGAVSDFATSVDPTTPEGRAAIATGGASTQFDAVVNAGERAGEFIDNELLGGNAEDAAKEAAAIAEAAGQEALAINNQQFEQTRTDLAPFREAGAAGIPLLSGAINDPSSRVLNNPFFKSMAADQEQRLLASAAARGKTGSGGTNDDLQKNLLLLGNQFAQQDITNLQNLTNTGLNASAKTGAFGQQSAATAGGIIGNVANSQAAGVVGAANARSDATGNLLGIGALAYSDIRLKENVKFSHVESGIRMYNWSWTEEALGLVGDQDTTGPIAQELKKTHPELVTMDESTGFYKVLM